MRYPFTQQESYNDCGLACISMLYQFYFKRKLSIDNLKKTVTLTENGLNILQLKCIATSFNLKLESYKINFEQFKKLDIEKPVIIQIFLPNIGFHFIVVYKKKNNKILIANPQDIETIWLNIDVFNQKFSGIIIASSKLENKLSELATEKDYFSPFLVPKYWQISLILIINHLFLVIIFFISQVFYKNFISQIIVNNNLQIAVLLLLSFFIIKTFKVFTEFILNKLQQKFYLYFYNNLIEKFHYYWFTSKPMINKKYESSEYLQIYQDISNISTLFINNILEIIINFITAVFVSIILIKISTIIWLITLLNGIITLLIDFISMLWKKNLVKKNIVLKLDFQQEIILSQKYFEDAYFRNLISYLKNQVNKKYGNYMNNEWKLNSLVINNSSFINFIKNVLNFVTFYFSVILIFNHEIDLSQLIFITSINIYLISFFQNTGNLLLSLPNIKKSFQRFNNFFNFNQPKYNNNLNELEEKQLIIKVINCSLKIEAKFIFHNLNLELQSHNLLIGKNGVGKTTLMLLIALNYHNFTGTVTVNGISIHNFDKTWQQHCVYLSPNPIIYSGTILENILSFKITEEKILLFGKLNFEAMLNNFNLKSFDFCQNQGTNLSQGQKQIIVFLSLFFSNWRIILIDESLSNINFEFKIQLITLLLNHFTNSLIIYASHDLQLKSYFPKIINLNNQGG